MSRDSEGTPVLPIPLRRRLVTSRHGGSARLAEFQRRPGSLSRWNKPGVGAAAGAHGLAFIVLDADRRRRAWSAGLPAVRPPCERATALTRIATAACDAPPSGPASTATQPPPRQPFSAESNWAGHGLGAGGRRVPTSWPRDPPPSRSPAPAQPSAGRCSRVPSEPACPWGSEARTAWELILRPGWECVCRLRRVRGASMSDRPAVLVVLGKGVVAHMCLQHGLRRWSQSCTSPCPSPRSRRLSTPPVSTVYSPAYHSARCRGSA